jgi:hypothetical protein
MKNCVMWFSGFLFIVLASCNKGGESPITIGHDTTGTGGTIKYTEPRLIGKWNWLSSTLSTPSSVITPQTTGYTLDIEFLNDSVFNYYRNDTLILHTSYQIVKGKSIYDSNIQKLILIKGSQYTESYLFPASDSLTIRVECLNCYTDQYAKH